jgi:hypothetical protein
MDIQTEASGVAPPEAINVSRKADSNERGRRNVAHLTGHALRKRGLQTPLSDFLHDDQTGGRVRAAMAPPTWWRARP